MKQEPQSEAEIQAEKEFPGYRWLVLAVAWLSFFGLAMSWYIMPTLEHEIMELFNIDAAGYSRALTIPFLMAALLSFGGGMLADRWGLRKTATLGILIAGGGIMLRAQSASYGLLFLAMALLGVGMGLIMPNLPKLVSAWFPPGEAGLATGIYNTGLMGGISTGLVIAPFLPGWTGGNLLLGGMVIALGVIFFLVVRDAPPGHERPEVSILSGLKSALRSRNAWAAASAVFLGLAGMVSIQNSLPSALHEVYGLDMAAGGRVTSLITYASMAGSLTLPALVERREKMKPYLVLLIIGFPVLMYGTWLLGEYTVILWTGTLLAGYIAGGSLPLFMSIPVHLPHYREDPVRSEHVGGASGLLTAFMNMGGFVGFPFIVTPIIVSLGHSAGLLVACILFALQALSAQFLDEPREAR